MGILIDEFNGDKGSGLPIEPDVIFSNHKKVFKSGIKKRQSKLLAKIDFLKPFLSEDEVIMCVTTGCSPMSLLEQWLMGLWIFYIKRCLFVFTNERIIHIPTTTDYSYRNSIAQIPYVDCRSIILKGHTLTVKYHNNTKERFYYIGSKERKKIKAFLKDKLFSGTHDTTQARTHLCPRCTGELVENVYACPHCDLEFKNKAEARKISIIYPGGGYFYTRHPILGVSDAIVEIMLTFTLITFVTDAIRWAKEDDIISVIFIAVALAVEKAVTVYDSNKFIKEYIPIEKKICYLEQDASQSE